MTRDDLGTEPELTIDEAFEETMAQVDEIAERFHELNQEELRAAVGALANAIKLLALDTGDDEDAEQADG